MLIGAISGGRRRTFAADRTKSWEKHFARLNNDSDFLMYAKEARKNYREIINRTNL
jgi:hypothetical protein